MSPVDDPTDAAPQPEDSGASGTQIALSGEVVESAGDEVGVSLSLGKSLQSIARNLPVGPGRNIVRGVGQMVHELDRARQHELDDTRNRIVQMEAELIRVRSVRDTSLERLRALSILGRSKVEACRRSAAALVASSKSDVTLRKLLLTVAGGLGSLAGAVAATEPKVAVGAGILAAVVAVFGWISPPRAGSEEEDSLKRDLDDLDRMADPRDGGADG